MELKTCSRCKHEKQKSEFFRWKRGKDGLDYHCKPCKRLFNLESYRRNKEKHRARAKLWAASHPDELKIYHRNYYLKNRELARKQSLISKLSAYSITLEKYDALLLKQDGKCAICKRPPEKRRLAIDHDHSCCPPDRSCGKCIRGLLCFRCNSLLGFAGDNPTTLRQAADYLTYDLHISAKQRR